MHKLLVLYPHPQDEKKFRRYYETRHVPLTAKMSGLLASRYSVEIKSPGRPAPYYCVFEAGFESEAAMGAAMQSAAGQAVVADGPNYATTPPIVLHYGV
jgi:uncharacterized protein (TIGR02118 family)